MAERTINYELLEKVRNRLKRLRHPEHFDMGTWGNKTDCGTAACIGGYGLIVAGKITPTGLVNLNQSTPYWEMESKLKSLFGVDQAQCDRLFYTAYWPELFRDQYNNSNDPRQRRDIAVKRIEHFIQTQGKE